MAARKRKRVKHLHTRTTRKKAWAAFKKKHTRPGMGKTAYKAAVRKHWRKTKCNPSSSSSGSKERFKSYCDRNHWNVHRAMNAILRRSKPLPSFVKKAISPPHYDESSAYWAWLYRQARKWKGDPSFERSAREDAGMGRRESARKVAAMNRSFVDNPKRKRRRLVVRRNSKGRFVRRKR
jgi:hypothetical protein